ncbi:MAG: BolA family transcriptional regulator [Alphaproteobacteria bacterium]|nr:BolA family transcriptional regulator [Alphaproteobacteria bacterium]
MSTAETIRARLEQSLAPVRLEIMDESHRHEGHSGARPSGETHFNVTIVASIFTGKTRVARHRMVFDILGDLMDAPVHALSLSTLTPEEAGSM